MVNTGGEVAITRRMSAVAPIGPRVQVPVILSNESGVVVVAGGFATVAGWSGWSFVRSRGEVPSDGCSATSDGADCVCSNGAWVERLPS